MLGVFLAQNYRCGTIYIYSRSRGQPETDSVTTWGWISSVILAGFQEKKCGAKCGSRGNNAVSSGIIQSVMNQPHIATRSY